MENHLPELDLKMNSYITLKEGNSCLHLQLKAKTTVFKSNVDKIIIKENIY